MSIDLSKYLVNESTQGPSVTITPGSLQHITTLGKESFTFPTEDIFRAKVSRMSPEMVEQMLAEVPNAPEIIASQWHIWKQRKGIGAVPCTVSLCQLVVEKMSDERITFRANIYGHDLKWDEQETAEGKIYVPAVDEAGNFIIIDKNDAVNPNAEARFLMQLNIKPRTMGSKVFWEVDAVGPTGYGAVVQTSRKAKTDASGMPIAGEFKSTWNLVSDSVPLLQQLILGTINSPEAPDAIKNLVNAAKGGNATQVAVPVAPPVFAKVSNPDEED